MKEKSFLITNHNRYKTSYRGEYDEYSMIVLCDNYPYHSTDQKAFILNTLEHDLGFDVAEHVTINLPAYFNISNLHLAFGLFVFDLERSLLIKLIYS